MWNLILRRIALSIPLIILISFLSFLLQALLPGDAARAILGENYTPEAYAQLREQLGLDEPLLVRYWDWFTHAITGDLGTSSISGLDVTKEILSRMPVTLSLIVCTTLVAVIIGVTLGVISALRTGWLGRSVDVLSLAGFAIPNYWLGIVLVSVFAVAIPLFPATGYVPMEDSVLGWVTALVLPVTALAVYGIAVLAKQTRDSMSDTLARGFITVLRANGASEASIVFRHGLRNAAIPILTVVGLVFVGLLNGTVFVESVFALPGLGGLAVQSTVAGDSYMLQGVVVTFTLIVVLVNLLVDISYGWLSPKVRNAHA